MDDLTKIEGIGPKISEILRKNGINSFQALALANPADIKAYLLEEGSRYQMHDPSSWPEQAKLAAEGNWEQLKELQDKLNGGKTN